MALNRRELLQMLSGVIVGQGAVGVGFVEADDLPKGPWRLGINLTGVTYWTTEHPFENLAMTAARWRVQKIGQAFTWDTPLPPMTEGGYPTMIPDGSVIESFLIFTPRRKYLPIELSVHYDGTGRMGYIFGAELEARTPGRDEVRNLRRDEPFTARLFETDPNDPLRNIRVYERGRGPTGTFREAFLQRSQNMSVLRFMDWMYTNNSEVRSWDERPRKDRFTQSEGGIALEYLVELANTLKVAPWFNMPHLADDDYVRRFAEQVKETLIPSLPVYVEYSNEVWNSLFKQAQHALEQGRARGLSEADFEMQLRFYSQRTSEVLEIWETVFADQKERVLGVYATQAFSDWTSETVLSWKDAASHADVLAIAPYFGGGLGSPERASEVAGWSLKRLFDELGREVDTENKAAIEAQAVVANKFGLKLVAYEGGQHLVGHSGAENNEKLEELFKSANRDPRMGDLYIRHLAHWRAAGGDLFVLFSSMGEYAKWGSWGLLEAEATTNPKWEAVQQLLKASD